MSANIVKFPSVDTQKAETAEDWLVSWETPDITPEEIEAAYRELMVEADAWWLHFTATLNEIGLAEDRLAAALTEVKRLNERNAMMAHSLNALTGGQYRRPGFHNE